ncbi:MAG: hypothetical protein J6J93_08875 [Muribaculaceae bacterium]|nr:hypothetical protein [Muribaculaceae bacterium]
MTTKRLATLFLVASAAVFPVMAQTDASADSVGRESSAWKYIPKFHGVMRTYYEWSTATGKSRFEVNNARLNAGGYILPKADYFLQVDFCNNGKITLLDAYARLYPAEGLQIYAGQCRVPFSVESSRAPEKYHFASVGLVAELGNLRSVGVKAGYTIPKSSVYLEGGVFNGTDRSDHTQWNSQLTYSIKANCTYAGFRPEVAFMSRVPGGQDDVPRFNQGNVSLSWTLGGFMIEGEYIRREYTGSDASAEAWDVFADYGFDVDWKLAKRLSFQARYDGVTTADIERKRITIGTTARYSCQNAFIDFRINYEQYFYSENAGKISPSGNNKLVAGAVLYF